MKETSATANVLQPLRVVGLIDDNNKPTDRAVRWRDDDQYSRVCEEIRREVYPEELWDTFPEVPDDKSAVARWFANRLRVGIGAASKMTNFYTLLLEADPTKQATSNATPQKSDKTRAAKREPKPRQRGPGTEKREESADPQRGNASVPQGFTGAGHAPSLHIDVQVHISPEASPEQIDAIFASMSKHLYKSDGA